MLRLGEPLETVVEADGLLGLVGGEDGKVQGDVPEGIDRGRHALARLANHIALKLTLKKCCSEFY